MSAARPLPNYPEERTSVSFTGENAAPVQGAACSEKALTTALVFPSQMAILPPSSALQKRWRRLLLKRTQVTSSLGFPGGLSGAEALLVTRL